MVLPLDAAIFLSIEDRFLEEFTPSLIRTCSQTLKRVLITQNWCYDICIKQRAKSRFKGSISEEVTPWLERTRSLTKPYNGSFLPTTGVVRCVQNSEQSLRKDYSLTWAQNASLLDFSSIFVFTLIVNFRSSFRFSLALFRSFSF